MQQQSYTWLSLILQEVKLLDWNILTFYSHFYFLWIVPYRRHLLILSCIENTHLCYNFTLFIVHKYVNLSFFLYYLARRVSCSFWWKQNEWTWWNHFSNKIFILTELEINLACVFGFTHNLVRVTPENCIWYRLTGYRFWDLWLDEQLTPRGG